MDALANRQTDRQTNSDTLPGRGVVVMTINRINVYVVMCARIVYLELGARFEDDVLTERVVGHFFAVGVTLEAPAAQVLLLSVTHAQHTSPSLSVYTRRYSHTTAWWLCLVYVRQEAQRSSNSAICEQLDALSPPKSKTPHFSIPNWSSSVEF